MQGWLTLSRAARLVGATRGALQRRIKEGELPTFEGMVSEADLLRLFPDTRMEDNSFIERLNHLKDAAFSRRLRDRLLPDAEVLAARLVALGRELGEARSELDRYRGIISALMQRLGGPGDGDGTAIRKWLVSELERTAMEQEQHALAARDTFLRVMTAQVRLLPSGREFLVEGADSILDAALRAGLPLPYGCSNGNCGACKARVVAGQVKKLQAHDYVLTETERAEGVVLLCCNTAVGDLTVDVHVAGDAHEIPKQRIEVKVRHLDALGGGVRLLHVQTPRTQRLRFLAGQSVLLSVGGATAELPVASCPCDERNLHFHLREQWGDPFIAAALDLKNGESLTLEGPLGSFVLEDESPRPILFVACDDGFAPIKSLIEHAVALENAESLHLYWLARSPGGHYLDNQCRAWADAFDHFHYVPLLALPAAGATAVTVALEAIPLGHADLSRFDAYVAGPEQPVTAATQTLLAAGLPRERLRTLVLRQGAG